jgi:phosphoenolpyruvate synthase/pyruvate phosphate dikinase
VLRRLARAGIAVPPGVCVPADVHRRAMEEALPSDALDALLSRLPEAGARLELERVSNALEVPRPLAEELRAAVRRAVGPGTVAVRSSAPGEDTSGASFAGVYTSLLDVPQGRLARAVVACWASLWSEAATAYSTRRGRPAGAAAMPVLIQAMIRAEAAAVVFTGDRAGTASRVSMELVRGPAPPLVDGAAMPDWIELAGAALEPIAVERGADGIEADLACARPLAEAALDVEALLGRPVDLEAAYADGAWWILQARPITA